MLSSVKVDPWRPIIGTDVGVGIQLLLLLNLGVRLEWMVNVTLRPLYFREELQHPL